MPGNHLRLLGATMIAFGLNSCTPKTPPQNPAKPPAAHAIVVDDAQIGTGIDQFSYAGKWQHRSGFTDGRYKGTSSRSFTPGDTASIAFYGRSIKLYGIDGPEGGWATLAFDGNISISSFFSKTKKIGVLVFATPILPEGPHSLVIVVGDRPKGIARDGYVNVDYARIEP